MAKPGPKPTPTQLKKLTGNPGKRSLQPTKAETGIKPGRPKKPTKMFTTAGRLFNEVADALDAIKAISAVDGPALALAAQHYAIALEASRILKDEGLTIENARGAEVKHPLTTVMNQHSNSYRLYAASFGLTPADRASMKISANPNQMSLAEELFAVASQMQDGDDE